MDYERQINNNKGDTIVEEQLKWEDRLKEWMEIQTLEEDEELWSTDEESSWDDYEEKTENDLYLDVDVDNPNYVEICNKLKIPDYFEVLRKMVVLDKEYDSLENLELLKYLRTHHKYRQQIKLKMKVESLETFEKREMTNEKYECVQSVRYELNL